MTDFNKRSQYSRKILLWLISLAVPIILVVSTVRLVLLNPMYYVFEYRTPGFPDDPYGFSLEERLKYSKIAITYLVNEADISFLGNLRFPEGQTAPDFSCQFMEDCTRLYNERELEHMVDVKNVVQISLNVWYVALVFVLVTGIWSWRAGWWDDFRSALSRGGFVTLPLIGLLLAFILVAFGAFFVFFHGLFFTEGTWTFYYSDTLIRMFPERFWRDTFLFAGLLIGLGGLVIGFAFKPRFKRRQGNAESIQDTV